MLSIQRHTIADDRFLQKHEAQSHVDMLGSAPFYNDEYFVIPTLSTPSR